MSENIRFDITVHTGCDRLQNRSLRAAAAVCLRNAVGGRASVFWPGDIVADDKAVGSVSCAASDGGAVLSFDIAPAFAREGLKEELEAALVATAIFTGMGQGIQPLASEAFGLNNRDGMRTLQGYIRCTVTLLSVLIFALVFFFAQPIASAFNHEQNMQLQTMAESGLRIYFAGYLFAGVNIAACAFLSAVSRPRQALLISLLRSCMLLIPAAILLSLALNTTGVWLAFLITEAACCVISLVFLKAAAK